MNLVIRANATAAIGAGHVMRCSHLAEAWLQDGGTAVFSGDIALRFVKERIRDIGASMVNGSPSSTADVLLCDSYDGKIREECRGYPAAFRVLVDDLGGVVHERFDAIWNPNAYDAHSLYPGYRGRILSGTQFVPARRVLPRWSKQREDVAVIFGGSSLPATLVDAVAKLPGRIDAPTVAAGSWVPQHWGRLPERDPWDIISQCDRLLTTAGSGLWEAATVGVPVAVVCIAENQRLIFEWALANGAPGVDCTDHREDSDSLSEELAKVIRRAQPLSLPAGGATNAAKALRSLASAVVT